MTQWTPGAASYNVGISFPRLTHSLPQLPKSTQGEPQRCQCAHNAELKSPTGSRSVNSATPHSTCQPPAWKSSGLPPQNPLPHHPPPPPPHPSTISGYPILRLSPHSTQRSLHPHHQNRHQPPLPAQLPLLLHPPPKSQPQRSNLNPFDTSRSTQPPPPSSH